MSWKSLEEWIGLVQSGVSWQRTTKLTLLHMSKRENCEIVFVFDVSIVASDFFSVH